MKKYLPAIFLLIFVIAMFCPAFAQKKISFRMEIDPLIGGGYAGDNMRYIIKSNGEVLRKREELIGPPKIVLIKKVDVKEIDKLKKELQKADIWKMETGSPRYSGEEWKITIDGRTKTLYFSITPDKLKTAKEMTDKIIRKPAPKSDKPK